MKGSSPSTSPTDQIPENSAIPRRLNKHAQRTDLSASNHASTGLEGKRPHVFDLFSALFGLFCCGLARSSHDWAIYGAVRVKKEFETQVRDVIKALIRLGSESGTQVRDLNNSGSDFFGLCEKN